MRLFKSLRFRLIFLVLLAVIPAMAVTFFNGITQRRLAKANAEEDALRLARVVSSFEAAQIEGARQLTLALSLSSSLAPENPQQCNQFLHSIHQRLPMYSSLSFATANGDITCTSLADTTAKNISNVPYFQEALKTGDFVIGNITTGFLTGKIILPMAMPVKDASLQTIGVFIASLDTATISNMAVDIQLPPDSALLIVSRDGTVLYRYPGEEQYSGRVYIDEPLIRQILSRPGEGISETPGLDSVNRIYAFTPLETEATNQLLVSVGIPTAVAFADVDREFLSNMLWISFIALMAIAVAWFAGDLLFLRVVSLTAERDKAEAKLREANQQLETRVIERTAELDVANKQLSVELEERQKTLFQLRRRETELKKMLVLVERSNRELESFAYITSHDLQEPLRKIQAFSDRLTRRYSENLDEEGVGFISRMSAAANRMQLMINDLLSYSRLTTQAGEFKPVDLNQIAADVLSDLEVRLEETGGQVIIDPLPTIFADSSQMRQLLMNLINNGIKFHRPDVPPAVHVKSRPVAGTTPGGSDNKIEMTVEDNGIGFDEKYLDRIFLPFQRLHGHDIYEGSGIGLAICRKIAERHGGSITAKSTPNEGSCFIITLSQNPDPQNGDS